MKSDINGCSTCPKGEERYETFKMKIGRKVVKRVQYDYRHKNSELFSTVKPTLEECRAARNAWLFTIDPDAALYIV
ncbi:MAG: DUF3873 family protein [Bacteroidales bacterium]|nr:DUF3873 family protein [Bacteroidales bacterium]